MRISNIWEIGSWDLLVPTDVKHSYGLWSLGFGLSEFQGVSINDNNFQLSRFHNPKPLASIVSCAY